MKEPDREAASSFFDTMNESKDPVNQYIDHFCKGAANLSGGSKLDQMIEFLNHENQFELITELKSGKKI